MNTTQLGKPSDRQTTPLPRRRRTQGTLLAVLILTVFGTGSFVRAQYPPPPPPSVTGATLGDALRNSANTTGMQADIVRRTANDWGRRAQSGFYNVQQLERDMVNMRNQFAILQGKLNELGNLAAQLGRPRANNAVAELNAGLVIIAEVLGALEFQFNQGRLDRANVVRSCRSFDEVMAVWQREFRNNTQRLGMAR